MSVTTIWEDKRAHSRWNGWYCLVCLSHGTRGGRKGKQGRWSYVLHKETWVSMPEAFPFQNTKEAIVTNLFWPQLETPDPSLEIYFHGRTKSSLSWHPGEHTHSDSPVLGIWALVSLRYTWHRLCPLWWPLLDTATLGFSEVHCGVVMSWLTYSLPLAPFHLVTFPALRSPHWNEDDRKEIFLLWVPGRWAVGKGHPEWNRSLKLKRLETRP